MNEDVSVSGSSGEVTAETVNGDVTLSQVDAHQRDRHLRQRRPRLRRTDPERRPLRLLDPQRRHHRHASPEGTNASVSVSTFNGEFDLGLPGHADRDPEGQALQLHPRHRQRPGDAGVLPGHHRTRAPRSCPGRTRMTNHERSRRRLGVSVSRPARPDRSRPPRDRSPAPRGGSRCPDRPGLSRPAPPAGCGPRRSSPP